MKKIIIRRIIEVICVEIFISALAMSLYFFDLLKDRRVIFFLSAFILVLYLLWTVRCLYRFRVVFDGKKSFFAVNVPIYSVLFATAIIAGFFTKLDEDLYIYSFLFMPFKMFRYAAKIWIFPGSGRMTRPVSALLVSILIAIPVVIIPFYLSTDRKMYIKKVE